jgi:hypothetical protein
VVVALEAQPQTKLDFLEPLTQAVVAVVVLIPQWESMVVLVVAVLS